MPNPATPQGATPGAVDTSLQPQVLTALKAYDEALNTANGALKAAQDNLATAINDYNNASSDPTDIAGTGQKVAESRIASAQTAVNTALADRQRAADTRAKAYGDAAQQADPTTRATLQAQSQKAQTDAQQAAAQLQEWQGASDDRKAVVSANIRKTNADANKQELDNAFQAETDPTRKALLGQQLATATSQSQTAAADAAVATQVAGLRVQQGQANVTQTQAQTGLVGGQTAEANANANRTNALLPGEVAQQGGTLGETNARAGYYGALGDEATSRIPLNQAQANEANARADPVKAAMDRAQELLDAYKAGKLPNLPDPSQLVQDAITAATSGSTPFDIFKQQQGEETARLNQQVLQRDVAQRLQGQKAATFGGLVGTGLTQMTALNNTLPPGSDAAGKGFAALYTQALKDLGGPSDSGPFSLGPPVSIPSAPSYLDSYRSQQPAQAAPAPQPAAAADQGTGGTGHTITINIGGSGGTPQLQGNASGTGGNGVGVSTQPFQAQGADQSGNMPSYLANQQLATPQHVAAMFQGGPV